MANFPIEYAEVDQLYRQTVGQGLGVITLCAVEAGEGSTLTSKTLAERAAFTSQKTLLIDLNIANSTLHRTYGLEQIDWQPTQSDKFPIQSTGIENLSLLAAPKQSACRWEFRDMASILACINDLRSQFEVIIIDTSPLCRRNQGNVPAETLCTCADGTVLCILTGCTSETKIRDAIDLLQSVNANIHGAVMNDRFAPSLVTELIRETYRFNKYFPKLMTGLRKFFRNSTLLNQDI